MSRKIKVEVVEVKAKIVPAGIKVRCAGGMYTPLGGITGNCYGKDTLDGPIICECSLVMAWAPDPEARPAMVSNIVKVIYPEHPDYKIV